MKTTTKESHRELIVFLAVCISSIVTLIGLFQNIKHIFVSATEEVTMYSFLQLF